MENRMNLYVIRHAKAVEGSMSMPDGWRCLADQGRADAKIMRTRLAAKDIKPHLIITSPLVMAVQTAEILAEKIQRSNLVIASGHLLPDANIEQLISYLQKFKESKSIMVVGHEPLLGLLVTALLDHDEHIISLKKGSCVALDVHFGKKIKVDFLWYLTPQQKLRASLAKAFL
jgi:phosphohistidine phosphatase